MPGFVDNQTVEQILSPNAVQYLSTFTTTILNGTLALSSPSTTLHFLTGTATGFAVTLPNATTLQNGHEYLIYNTSSQTILVRNGAGGNLVSISANSLARFNLQNNTTAAGIWVYWFVPVGFSGTGGTATAGGCLNFGYNGTAGVGRWLEVIGNNPSNNTPLIIAGNKIINFMSCSYAGNTTCTATLFKNAVALDTISVTANDKATKAVNWPLVDGDELSMQVTAGTGSRPCVTIWM